MYLVFSGKTRCPPPEGIGPEPKGFIMKKHTAHTAPAAELKFWRSNARDARTGEPINGRPAIVAYLPQTGATPRPFLPETWQATCTAAEAAAQVVGKSTAGRLYQCELRPCKCETADRLHAAFIGRNGSQPVWYHTAEGYASPTYRNLKWHDRLEVAEEFMAGGSLTVTIRHEADGALIDTVSIKWGSRDELGRYLKRAERGNKSLLLALIDEAIHG